MTQFSFAACPLCQFKIKRSKQRLISVFEGQKFRSSLEVVKWTTTNYIVNIIGPIARIQCLKKWKWFLWLHFVIFFPAVTALCVCMSLYVSECASMTDRWLWEYQCPATCYYSCRSVENHLFGRFFLNQENLGSLANEGSNYMKDEQTGGDNICCCIGVIKRTRNMQLA